MDHRWAGVRIGGIGLMLAVSVALLASLANRASAGWVPDDGHPVQAELVAQHTAIRPGSSTRVGVWFVLQDDWHIYAEDPGDAGLPTSVEWSVPEGLTVGPLHWPRPEAFLDPGDIRTHGYQQAVLLHSEVSALPAADPGDTLPIGAAVTWLACREVCIPGSATLELMLPISAGPVAPSAHAELFAKAQETRPAR